MRRKNPRIGMGRIVLLIILTALFVFPTGCKKEEEKEGLFVCLLGVHYQLGSLSSDPIADPAQSEVVVKWNGNSHIFYDEEISDEILYFRDTLDLDTLKMYTEELTFDVGHCDGTVLIPGATIITSPTHIDTQSLGDITCDWSPAQGVYYY